MERKAVTGKFENGLYFNKVYDKQTQLSRDEEVKKWKWLLEVNLGLLEYTRKQINLNFSEKMRNTFTMNRKKSPEFGR